MNLPARWGTLLICFTVVVAASAQELTVSTAASMGNAMHDIGLAYRAFQPGVTLNFNIASSGALLAQIAQGAPVDVFASADLETMDRAQAQQLILPATRANFAANELVLISPRQRPATLTALPDLRGSGVQRIAIGTPANVPAGRYAQAALQRAGLWSALVAKLVYADNVRQALDYVSRAEADAGFVYRTDAMTRADAVRIDFAVPTQAPVLYPIATVAASRNPAASSAFIAFVRGPQGQAVFARHGFAPP
jgi:molybdate transport system substrate-binding protein